MAKVKICGLTRMQDIEAVNRCKPDYAGFVFAAGRRRLSLETAKPLVQALDTTILPVGVFVDEDAETVAEIAKACMLGAVQLHGDEDNAYISRLSALLPVGMLVIKAIRVRDAASLAAAEQIHSGLLMLDAYTPGQAGGMGSTFDWRLLQGFGRPYLLAGGLNAGNIEEAIGLLHPFGVDISSGVETNGVKDAKKIEEFIGLTRRLSR